MKLGADISKWQVFNSYFQLVLGGIDFLYIKHSQGVWEDPMFQTHRAGAKTSQLPAGGYHFLVAGNVVTAIRGFLMTALTMELMPVLDVEDSSLTRGDVQLAIDTWRGETSQPGIVYTRANIWSKIGVPLPPGWILWVAYYPRTWWGAGPLTKLKATDNILVKIAAWLLNNQWPMIGSERPRIWQFDDRAIAPTFGTDPYKSKSLDLNVFDGQLEELMMAETEPPIMQKIMTIRTVNRMNVRSSPAGDVTHSIGANTEVDIYEMETAILNGVEYTWGVMASGGWIATDLCEFVRDYQPPLWVAVVENGTDQFITEVQAYDDETASLLAVEEANMEGGSVVEMYGPYEKAE